MHHIPYQHNLIICMCIYIYKVVVVLSWSIIIDNPLFTDNTNTLSSSSYPIPEIGHVTTLQRPRCKLDGSPFGTSFEHSSRDPFVVLVARIWPQLHQVRLVVEIPVFTMGFIYTSQVVIAGYLNHHHVSSMYLGQGLILICRPIKEGHFLIQVSPY